MSRRSSLRDMLAFGINRHRVFCVSQVGGKGANRRCGQKAQSTASVQLLPASPRPDSPELAEIGAAGVLNSGSSRRRFHKTPGRVALQPQISAKAAAPASKKYPVAAISATRHLGALPSAPKPDMPALTRSALKKGRESLRGPWTAHGQTSRGWQPAHAA